jgi:N-acetylmuramoyl-L-alanine amidase
MKWIAALAASGMLLMGQGEQPVLRSVTAVRYWSLKDVTRVAVEVSSSFEFHTDRLHNPERVYFDILKARQRIEPNKLVHTENVTDNLLQRIRVAETNPGITRVVLDLNDGVQAAASTLTNPDRLIIELRMPAAVTAHTQTQPPVPVVHAAAPAPAPPVAAAAPAIKPVPAPARTPATEPVRTELRVPGISPDPPRPEEAAADTFPAHAPAAPAPPEEVATGARHTSSGTSSLIRTLGLKINRVVIDPGHGGHDQGTEGPKGLLEKDLVLDVALRLGKLVQDRMGAEVIYTRSDDTFVTLQRRTDLANEKKADLFLSIHANSTSILRIAGPETYYLNINGSKDAMDVAARENGPTQNSIFELQDIIRKIALHDKSEESREFAKRVDAALYAFSLKNFPGNKDRGVKTAPFVVLIGANMPSVLAEIGFVSNAREEALLKKPDYRQRLAEALYKGMEKYAESLSHFLAADRP